MSKFKKKGKNSSPGISTASLPDIVFILLFFFMVATKMKEVDLNVEVESPKASETIKVKRGDKVLYIYLGLPRDTKRYGNTPIIQLDDELVYNPVRVQEWIKGKKEDMTEIEKKSFTVSLKIDKGVKMGIVADIKMHLREVNALKIMYATKKSSRDEMLEQ